MSQFWFVEYHQFNEIVVPDIKRIETVRDHLPRSHITVYRLGIRAGEGNVNIILSQKIRALNGF